MSFRSNVVGHACLVFALLLGCQPSKAPPPRKASADIKVDTSLQGLQRALRHKKRWVRAKAIMILPKHGKKALPTLAKALHELGPALQMGAMAGMESIGVAAIPYFLPLLQHRQKAIRQQATLSLVALYLRYSPKAERYQDHMKILIGHVLHIKDASVWRGLRRLLCQPKIAASDQVVTRLEQVLARNTPDAKADFNKMTQRGFLYSSVAGVPPPFHRLAALLSCRQPFGEATYKQLTSSVLRSPLALAARLMGLFAAAEKTPPPVISQAWISWLSSSRAALVVLALDRMATLRVRSTPELRRKLQELLSSGQPGQPWRAARLLGQWGRGATPGLSALSLALQSKQPRLRHAAAIAIARQGVPLASLLVQLKATLKDPNHIARAGALRALGEAAPDATADAKQPTHRRNGQASSRPTSQPASKPSLPASSTPVEVAFHTLKQALHAPQATLRDAATAALGQWARKGHERAVRYLVLALVDKDEDVRATAARALGQLKRHLRISVLGLTQALRDKAPYVRKLAAQGLGQMGLQGTPALQALAKAARSESDFLAKQTMLQAHRRLLHALRKHP